MRAFATTVLAVQVLFLTAPTAPRSLTAPTSLQVIAPATLASAAVPPVKAQILAINDFHGHLEPGELSISARSGTSDGPGAVPAGGAAYLAAQLKAARRANPASVVVSAGDMISGSPMISGYYHDESTIETMNKIIDVGVVGNHEFDEGTAEFRRIVDGGCHPVDGCQDGSGYAGAAFDVLAANVVDRDTGRSIYPGFVIKDVGRARIGFIGTVTADTPDLVPRSGIEDIAFLDEASTINRLAPQVRAAGADAVVVLTHNGAAQARGAKSGINSCVGMAGSVIDVVTAVTGQVDAVISAHTHQPYICKVKGTLLTSAASFGRLYTTIDLTLDPNTHRVTQLSARNAVVSHDIQPDATVAAVVKRYRRLLSPIAEREVGYLNETAGRQPNAGGETVLGNLIADAGLAATSPEGKGLAEIAISPIGFIAADLGRGPVSYGEVYAAQPFGQRLVTMMLTGRQLDEVLESQLCSPAAPSPNHRVPLSVSRGFSYRYDPELPCEHRVRISDFRLFGRRMTAGGTVRVTVNSFLAGGENGFTVLTAGTSRVTGELDRDALAGYLTAHPHLELPVRNRVALR